MAAAAKKPSDDEQAEARWHEAEQRWTEINSKIEAASAALQIVTGKFEPVKDAANFAYRRVAEQAAKVYDIARLPRIDRLAKTLEDAKDERFEFSGEFETERAAWGVVEGGRHEIIKSKYRKVHSELARKVASAVQALSDAAIEEKRMRHEIEQATGKQLMADDTLLPEVGLGLIGSLLDWNSQASRWRRWAIARGIV